MTKAARIGAGLAAAVANGGLLLAPVLILRGPPTIAEMAAVACVSIAVASEVWCAGVAPATSDGDLDRLNWAQGLALLLGFILELLWGWRQPGLPCSVIGVVAILMGAALRGMAIRKLQSGFTNGARPATAGLCNDGVYGWLRHPAETGLLLIAAGFPAVIGAWQAMAVVLPVLLVLSALRIRREERGLSEAFPDSFDAYRRRVPF